MSHFLLVIYILLLTDILANRFFRQSFVIQRSIKMSIRKSEVQNNIYIYSSENEYRIYNKDASPKIMSQQIRSLPSGLAF